MKITGADLFKLRIPFKLTFSHSKADRFFSDSIILKLSGRSSAGETFSGWGEAVVREYVSGSIAGAGGFMENLARPIANLLEPYRAGGLSDNRILETLGSTVPETNELPLLCAVETALLDLLCSAGSTDIYSLLGLEPLRNELVYGGTLPLLPESAAEKLLRGYKQLGITNLRVKIGSDPEYNRKTLSLVRAVMGDDYDIKVDTNAGWNLNDAEVNIPLLKDFGVSIVEEPFGMEPDGRMIRQLAASKNASGMIFMADESALTTDDISRAAGQSSFGMINIRLAKNGGLLKALEMARTADRLGIRYMAGCHVGETGILSAAGRAAASLMKAPEYTDGSYDSHLLAGNITEEDLSFGYGGKAPVIRGNCLGFKIDRNKLKGYTDEGIKCF